LGIWEDEDRKRGKHSGVYVHERETEPLHAYLCDPKQTSYTGKVVIDSTAVDCVSAFGEQADVGERGGGGDGAQQDEVRVETFRGAAEDDLEHLRDVGEEDAGEDEAGGVVRRLPRRRGE